MHHLNNSRTLQRIMSDQGKHDDRPPHAGVFASQAPDCEASVSGASDHGVSGSGASEAGTIKSDTSLTSANDSDVEIPCCMCNYCDCKYGECQYNWCERYRDLNEETSSDEEYPRPTLPNGFKPSKWEVEDSPAIRSNTPESCGSGLMKV